MMPFTLRPAAVSSRSSCRYYIRDAQVWRPRRQVTASRLNKVATLPHEQVQRPSYSHAYVQLSCLRSTFGQLSLAGCRRMGIRLPQVSSRCSFEAVVVRFPPRCPLSLRAPARIITQSECPMEGRGCPRGCREFET
jgi:hypothetical protein